MKKITDKQIIELLQQLKLKGQTDPSGQVITSFSIENTEYPMVVRILPSGELVQLLTFIPVQVEEKAVVDLGRFLHLANKELDMPGFCVDEASLTVFYRIVIPAIGHELDPKVFKASVSTSELVCKTFGTIIMALAAGVMTWEEVATVALKQSAK